MQQAILYSILPLFLKQKMNSSKNDYSDYDIYRTSSEMLIAVGIGECLGSLTSGKLTEIKGKKFGVLLVLIFGVLACVSGLICDQIVYHIYIYIYIYIHIYIYIEILLYRARSFIFGGGQVMDGYGDCKIV